MARRVPCSFAAAHGCEKCKRSTTANAHSRGTQRSRVRRSSRRSMHPRCSRFAYGSNMSRKLEVVLFDLDDTLHDDTHAFTSAAEEVAREIALERGVDALALKRAYIAESEGFWHRLSAEQLRSRLAGLRDAMWNSALCTV